MSSTGCLQTLNPSSTLCSQILTRDARTHTRHEASEARQHLSQGLCLCSVETERGESVGLLSAGDCIGEWSLLGDQDYSSLYAGVPVRIVAATCVHFAKLTKRSFGPLVVLVFVFCFVFSRFGLARFVLAGCCASGPAAHHPAAAPSPIPSSLQLSDLERHPVS